MKISKIANSRVTAVAAGAAVLAVVAGGTAVAAGQIGSDGIKNNSITSYDIKDGTLQKADLTANNFKKFTETSNVVTATTAASTVPAYTGAPVVDVPASAGATDTKTPLLTVQLDKGKYLVEATGQFWHLNGPTPTGADLGVLSFSTSGSGYANAFTADIPDGGTSPAQTSSSTVVTITADNTNMTVFGAIRGGQAGQAGATVVATKIGFKS